MTACDNQLFFWDLSDGGRESPISMSFSSSHDHLHELSSPTSQSFGGPRNPQQTAFIFDARPAKPSRIDCDTSNGDGGDGRVAIALSDGAHTSKLHTSKIY
jgi:hypothetical protein